MKVVILEDDKHYSSLVRAVVQDIATEVHVCTCWKEIDSIIDGADLFWVDLILPPNDTVETSLIRVADVRKRNQDMIILIVSGTCEHGMPYRAKQAGADAFANKMDVIQRNQVLAYVFLAMINACERGPKAAKILSRIVDFVTKKPLTT